MSKEISREVIKTLEEKDPEIFGDLDIVSTGNSHYSVFGRVYSKIENLETLIEESIHKFHEYATVSFSIETPKSGLKIKDPDSVGVVSNARQRRNVDEVNVRFVGMINVSLVNSDSPFKRRNGYVDEKMKVVLDVFEFITPIVVDQNYNVIDGKQRVEWARDRNLKKIPAVVLEIDDERFSAIRLLLNRSSEFQRWNYSEVDPVVDSMPGLQPIIEPFGFFGSNVMPTSFFGDTVVDYHIEDLNDQQKLYSQSKSLIEYAELRREQRQELEKNKEEKKSKKKKEGVKSLFDFEEDEVITREDPQDSVAKNVEHMKEVAGLITENYDEIRRAEKEASGQSWQNSRRTTRKLVADKKAKNLDSESDLNE